MRIMKIVKRIPPHILRRAISAFVAVVFVLSTIMTGTLAWSSLSQRATNAIEGECDGFPVELHKYALDLEGNPTEIRLQGAEFDLFRVNADGTSTQVGERLTTDENGVIRVEGLAPGDYYFREVRPPSGYTFDIDEDENPIERHDFTITGEDPDLVTIVTVYNRLITGDLIIEKIVENADGSDIDDDQKEIEFEFRVTFYGSNGDVDGNTYTYIIYCRDGIPGEELSIQSGETLFLRHSERAVFRNIPAGVTYTVVELPSPGFTVRSGDHQGTITRDVERRATFTNVICPRVGSLRVSKEIRNFDGTPVTDAQREVDFTFTLYLGDDEPVTFTLRHGGFEIFDNIPVGTPFRIVEHPVDGFTQTLEDQIGTIVVEGRTVMVDFINYYGDPDERYGDLRVSKEVYGGESDTAFTFTVIIGNDDPYTFTLRHGEYWLRENIPHGTRYTVIEHPAPGYSAEVGIRSGFIAGGTVVRADFVNPIIEYMEITIYKLVEGEIPERYADLEFHFRLTIDGELYEEFPLLADGSRTFRIRAGAMYIFEELVSRLPNGWTLVYVRGVAHGTATDDIVIEFVNRFEEDDERIYIDVEKRWEYSVTNPLMPEYIVVQLMDGNRVVASATIRLVDGSWTHRFVNIPKHDVDGNVIEYTVRELPVESWRAGYYGCPEEGFEIVNTYIPPAVIDDIPVEKRITGETPERDSQFRFMLSGAQNAPMPSGTSANNNTRTVTVMGEGTANFGSITFRAPGTFVYTITEMNDGVAGYVYDESVYTLTVVVEEYNGELRIASRVIVRDGVVVDGVVFVNEYVGGGPPVDDETTIIEGTKTWVHGELHSRFHPGSITVLVKVDGVIVAQRLVTARDHWNWRFVMPRHDADGNEIVYTIDEVRVVGYTKAINGFNITNTFNPNDPDVPPEWLRPIDPDTLPPTGVIWPWIALMALSMSGLVVIFTIKRKKKRLTRLK